MHADLREQNCQVGVDVIVALEEINNVVDANVINQSRNLHVGSIVTPPRQVDVDAIFGMENAKDVLGNLDGIAIEDTLSGDGCGHLDAVTLGLSVLKHRDDAIGDPNAVAVEDLADSDGRLDANAIAALGCSNLVVVHSVIDYDY